MKITAGRNTNREEEEDSQDLCICCSGNYPQYHDRFFDIDSRRLENAQGCDDLVDIFRTDGDYALREKKRLEKSFAEKVVRKAREVSRSIRLDTGVEFLAPFDLNELCVGAKLGSGGFSDVWEVEGFVPNNKRIFTKEQAEARQELISNMKQNIRNNSNPFRKHQHSPYAIKVLRADLVERPKKFLNGAMDLVTEAFLLSAIRHPHIISIRGVAASGPGGFAKRRDHDGYFMIIDRLEETLHDRILNWRRKFFSLKRWIRRGHDKKRQQLLVERLMVALNIASALEYLHDEHNLIFRDLKPTNIGFDTYGEVRVFDFGLCRELPSSAASRDDVFRMSNGVGTPRYMAPEVRLRQKYNAKADVYSFTMVLYEIMSMDMPQSFKTKYVGTLQASVHQEAHICPCWPELIQRLLKQGWSVDPSKRPTMAEMRKHLEEEIQHQASGLDEGSKSGTTRPRRGSFGSIFSSEDQIQRLANIKKHARTTETASSRTAGSSASPTPRPHRENRTPSERR